MGETELRFRTVELTLVIQGSTFVGTLAPWMPRLLVNVRGSTSRMDLAVPEERRAECRFGAVGVLVGAAPNESNVAGDRTMAWRDVSLEQIESLLGAIDAFTSADVDGVPDTGDYFQVVTITGLVNGEAFGLTVSQMQSGWKGADAARFVEILRCIFGIAGLSLDQWHGMGRIR